ncbi:hydroxyacid dehydrogenase [Bacillus litorisediminis]|uniref:hydroxyacid dehydrogenase n=1 Tax=Bacillus litorisediminis TaxID=2922713 RepID=UPI001FAC4607|nr:hydroxyacid dehydrogenase [Bacillus litorisediminis]
MKKPKVLQILSMYHQAGEKILSEGADVVRTDELDVQILKDLVSDADGIVLRAPARVTREIIDAAPNLKVISGAGVGLDNIDVKYATEKGIMVLHAPAVNDVSTAEHAILLIMALSKSLIPFHSEMSQGNYGIRMLCPSYELKGKRAGIVGFGSIAKEVAKRLKLGFEMDVIVWVRRYNETKHQLANELGLTVTTNLDELFQTSDFISLHIPLTPETKGIIDNHHFQMMKPTAYLINTARGAIINHDDLYEVLKNNKIAGAALDVFDPEPPPKNWPLLSLPNVIVTPHVGGTTVESNYKMATTVAKNVLKALAGEKPDFIGNPEVLDQ